jgi:hypothetical protein
LSVSVAATDTPQYQHRNRTVSNFQLHSEVGSMKRSCSSNRTRRGAVAGGKVRCAARRPKNNLIEGLCAACTSNPFQLLDLIHHQFVELLGFCNFNHGACVGVALSCTGHLGYAQTRELPSGIACLVRSHRDNKVGSHDLPSTALFDCSRSLQSRQWCVQGTASRRALEIG